WGVTYSQVRRNAPDTRDYLFDYNLETETVGDLASSGSNNTRSWESLKDDAWDVFLNTSMPLKFTQDITSTLTVGARYFDKQRDSSTRILAFETANASRFAGQSIDEIFSDPNISDSQR